MRAKVCKCHNLVIQGSMEKLVNPELELAGGPILFIGSRSIKFIGIRIQVPHDVTMMKKMKKALIANLDCMQQAVDTCPLTWHQKLRL